MKVQVLISLTQLFVIHAITVPPIWPSKNGFYRDQTTAVPITHEQFRFPSFFPEDSKISATRDQFNLQLQPSIQQNVHIYHPPPIRPNNGMQNPSPQSFQTVNRDNNNRPIYPKTDINKTRRTPKRRPTKKKLPVVHQHLTEVTAIPPSQKPATTNIKISRARARAAVDDEESSENLEDDSKEEISEHEQPKQIPTRPNYPGEGQWAKFGLKHNPNPQIRDSIKVQETAEDEDERPEGYETYERGEEQFAVARNKFKNNVALFPQKHALPPSQIDEEESDEPLYKKPEIGFVPQKLYTQVRRTENEKHLPRSAIDPDEENAERLRETVKDSIIHTVYTEEGYEDSAYDHAGQEKNAENSEGHAESSSDQAGSKEKGHGRGNSRYSDEGGRRYGNNNVAKKLRNKEKTKLEDFEDNVSYRNSKKNIENDAEEAASSHESRKISNKAELPEKEFKKVTVKNKDHEDINMDIYTEVKYTPQLKKHKYIKIIPSVKQSETETEKPVSHTRVKRYDKESLSKRYIRKRPSYYWKKKRTTTTERTQVQSKKFENPVKPTLKKKPGRTTTEIPQEIPDEDAPQTFKAEPETTTKKITATTVPSTTSSTTPYTITLPPVSKSITTISNHQVNHHLTTAGISAPKLVEELHPDLMNPELTTKAPKRSAPKVPPVKIKKFVNKRPKRYAIDYPKINVDLKEFVDVEKLQNPTEKPDLTFIKYPYYNLPVSDNLNENSPLRYAEDTKNIPEKVEDEMSFYESRNHIICKEVESDVNPIPDRVKNQEEGEETDKMAETPNLPRLKGLGDKIDCFKEKYFGENPLDSPFFQEDIIETPIPLFMLKNIKKPYNYKSVRDKKMAATKAMYYKMRKFDKNNKDQMQMKLYKFNNEEQQDGRNKKRELKIKVLEPIVVVDDEYVEPATMNPIHKTTEAVLKPPFTLEQMMSMHHEKYIKFNPENDFHQISLLEHTQSKEDNKEEDKPDKFLIIYENQDVVFSKNTPEIKPRQQKKKIQKPEKTDYPEIKPRQQKNKIQKPEKTDNDSKFSEIVSELTSSSFNKLPKEKLITTTSTQKPETYTRKQYIKRLTTKKPITKLSVKSIRKPTLRTTTTTTEIPQTTTYNYQERYTPKTLPYYSEIIPQPSRIFRTTTAPKTATSEKYEKLERFESSEKSEEAAEPEDIRNQEKSSEITSTNSQELPANWPTLNQRLSAYYNIFDINQYQTSTAPTTATNEKYEKIEKNESSEKSQESAELEEIQNQDRSSEKSQESAELEEIQNQDRSSEIKSTNSKELPANWPTLNQKISAYYNIFDINQYQTSTAPTTTSEKYEKIEKNVSLEKSQESEKYDEIEKKLSQESEEQEEIKSIDRSLDIINTSTNPPDLPANWPTLNRRLSAYYNIFDITQYFPQIPNPRIVPSAIQYKENITPSDQMKVYDDVLKTINEDKDEEKSDQQQKPEIEESQESEEAILVQGSFPVRTSTEQNTDYSENIAGLVPPPNALPYQQVYQYYNQYQLKPPPSEEQIAEASRNYKTFYFTGLTPPKTQRKRIKRDLFDKNVKDLLAQETNIDENYVGSNHRRIKRNKHQLEYPEDDLMTAESEYSSPQRRQKVYTEIVRNRPSRPQTEEPEEEEEEDLNPRKRIYELKSSRSTTTPKYPEFEEIIEEEAVEQTEAPTTRKPKIFPVEANKQNPQIAEYIFFIEKLKQKWAKEDATSTTTSTTEATTTAKASSKNTQTVAENRGEPAFLQIISQLHQIRKEEDAKTTTEPAVEITSAKVQAIPIKNSNPFLSEIGIPESFMSELRTMQLNLDHDNTAEGSTNPEVSRTRNYINRFRTTVDTSKYKTIERNPVNVRHNLSSRYNSDDEELPLKRGQTTQTPMIIAIISKPEDDNSTETPEEREIIAKVITERILEDSKASSSSSTSTSEPETTSTTSRAPAISTTSAAPAISTTLRSRQRGRGRSRPTTSTTARPPIASSTINPLFRRRRPVTRPSTTTTTSSPVTSSNQFRRRNRLKAAETRSILPQNLKQIAAETTETTVVITPPPEEPKKQRRFQKVQERRVTSEVTLTRYFEPLSGESEESDEHETTEESKKNQYEVIGPLMHTDTGHGGNYRHEHEPTTSSEEASTVASSESFFSDPSLAENVNQLKDAQQEEENTKSQASNNLFTNEEITGKVAEKPLHAKVSLYPNMARMVNRLADSQIQQESQEGDDEKDDKPTFIKDPSRRMYYYAKL